MLRNNSLIPGQQENNLNNNTKERVCLNLMVNAQEQQLVTYQQKDRPNQNTKESVAVPIWCAMLRNNSLIPGQQEERPNQK